MEKKHQECFSTKSNSKKTLVHSSYQLLVFLVPILRFSFLLWIVVNFKTIPKFFIPIKGVDFEIENKGLIYS